MYRRLLVHSKQQQQQQETTQQFNSPNINTSWTNEQASAFAQPRVPNKNNIFSIPQRLRERKRERLTPFRNFKDPILLGGRRRQRRRRDRQRRTNAAACFPWQRRYHHHPRLRCLRSPFLSHRRSLRNEEQKKRPKTQGTRLSSTREVCIFCCVVCG